MVEAFLDPTPRLEALVIEPLSDEIWESDYPYGQDDYFETDPSLDEYDEMQNDYAWTTLNLRWSTIRWPRLRQLTLRRARFDLDDFFAFLSKHSSGLELLKLCHVDFGCRRALSWKPILHHLHDHAINLHTIVLESPPIKIASNKYSEPETSKLGDYLFRRTGWTDDLEEWWTHCEASLTNQEDVPYYLGWR